MQSAQSPAWRSDMELPGFQALTLRFPDDYDGPVVATLVRRRAEQASGRAFLYVHGWSDYFFQEHMAGEFNAHGYNFYALDLRKYGRSLNGAHPNFSKDMREYLPDISAAITIITREEGNDYLVLGGHSTGGLITALYAHQGRLRARVTALWLNSPFLAFNNRNNNNARLEPLIMFAGRFAPFLSIRGLSTAYGHSLHRDHHGEWEFNTNLKPLEAFPAYFGWIRAVLIAQARVRRGLDIHIPVLLMHSDKSVYAEDWRPDCQTGDAVLDVNDMRAAVGNLGPHVKEVEIMDGLHDLTLSRPDVREQVFKGLFDWLDEIQAYSAENAVARADANLR